MENQEQKTNGALIGSVIIIIILIIGGIYLVKEKIATERENARLQLMQEENAQREADRLSESDDMSAIEADLNANSDMDSLGDVE